MLSRIERYLAHLDGLTGGAEPRVMPIEPEQPGPPGTFAIVYPELPEPGMTTGFSYGLSLNNRPGWTASKPELCVMVTSQRVEWPLAAATLADRSGPDILFEYGTAIDFGEQICDESDMSAFLILAPDFDDEHDYLGIDLGDDLPVNICGAYPIHVSEARLIGSGRLQAFLASDWDPCDVTRSPVQSPRRRMFGRRRP